MQPESHTAPEAPREQRERLAATLVWAAAVVGLYAFLLAMARYEPITGDGWYHVGARHHDFPTLIRRMLKLHEVGNPRFGQLFTMLTYRPDNFHVVVTPLMTLLLMFMVFFHAMGRAPRFDSFRDLSLFLVGIALCWLAAPTPGQTFFYRPITTNYIYTLALSLLLLLPVRLAWSRDPTAGGSLGRPLALGPAAIAIAVVVLPLSVAVGMMNEHTGPTWIAIAGLGALLAYRRKDLGNLSWMASACVGLLVGFLLLFFAPGQARRYGRLGQQSVFETIGQRGFSGNIELLGNFSEYVGPMLLVLFVITAVYGLVSRDRQAQPDMRARMWAVAVYVLVAAMIVGTSFAAPKNHYRLFIAPSVLLSIAALAVIDLLSRERLVEALVWVTAIAVNLGFMLILLGTYRQIHEDTEARVALIRSAQPGKPLVLPRIRHFKRDALYYGDSISADPRHRANMARYYGLDYDNLTIEKKNEDGSAAPKVEKKDKKKKKAKKKDKAKLGRQTAEYEEFP